VKRNYEAVNLLYADRAEALPPKPPRPPWRERIAGGLDRSVWDLKHDGWADYLQLSQADLRVIAILRTLGGLLKAVCALVLYFGAIAAAILLMELLGPYMPKGNMDDNDDPPVIYGPFGESFE
jgi:phage shock protein PspC (stress-responsive transcriptional regulator)